MYYPWISQGAFICFILCYKAMCSSVFEVTLVKLHNNLGLTHDGRCCSGSSSAHTPPCTSQCSTFFSVCLLHRVKTLPSERTCTFGSAVTTILGGNSIIADELDWTIFKLPINYAWPGTFTLIIEVWHDVDGEQTIYDSSQLIVQAFISSNIQPSHSWTDDKTVTPTAQLQVRYRLVCSRHYYGTGCYVMCRSRDDQFGHYTCSENGTTICNHGWTGLFCDKPECSAACLKNGGVCENPNVCRCRLGWYGPDCGQCRRYTGCQHGYCHQPYQCICEDGWAGLLCDIDNMYCSTVSPCHQGGTCVPDMATNYTCMCPLGYGGKNCQHELCYGTFCANDGLCTSSGGGRECSCIDGYYGDRCEHEEMSCEEMKCTNGGHCNMGKHGGSCSCPEHFTGKYCETKINPCMSNPCNNGADCNPDESFSHFTCSCPVGFGGHRCNIEIDPCGSITCYNSGKCRLRRNSRTPTCKCKTGYTGEFCQLSSDPCDDVTCLNGGTCKSSPMYNGFICHCPKGYHGEICESEMNPCNNAPCKNGAECKNYISTYLCICPNFLTGKHCEKRNMVTNRTLSTQNDEVRKTLDEGDLNEADVTSSRSSVISADSVLCSAVIVLSYSANIIFAKTTRL